MGDMKYFRQWAFNGLAAVSLILFVVMLVLWVRSYFVLDGISVYNSSNATHPVEVDVGSNRGVIQVIIYPGRIRSAHAGLGMFHNPPNPYRKTYAGFYFDVLRSPLLPQP